MERVITPHCLQYCGDPKGVCSAEGLRCLLWSPPHPTPPRIILFQPPFPWTPPPVVESANPARSRSVHLDATGQRHGQQPVFGTADLGVVKQDKSSRGSADTAKTRSDPQRVRMCKGERPIGGTKGKQTTPWPRAKPPPPSSHPGSLTKCLRPTSTKGRGVTCQSEGHPPPCYAPSHALAHAHTTAIRLPSTCLALPGAAWATHAPEALSVTREQVQLPREPTEVPQDAALWVQRIMPTVSRKVWAPVCISSRRGGGGASVQQLLRAISHRIRYVNDHPPPPVPRDGMAVNWCEQPISIQTRSGGSCGV